MKRNQTFVVSLLSLLALPSCSLMHGLEEDLTVAVRAKGELYYSHVVNSFNNAILPKMDASYVDSGMKFAGYTLTYDWKVDDGLDLLYKEGALIRYKDVKQYAYNGRVELYAQFVGEDEDIAPKHYMVLGWYNRPATSGLNEACIEKLTANLTQYLKDNGASEEDLSDFIVKGYEGNVGTIGGLIKEDGYVDVFIGCASNLKSTGGVDYVDRYQASRDYGEVTNRYVYLLRDKPVSRLVYEYCNTDAFYTIFE